MASGTLAATQGAAIEPLPQWLPAAEKQTLERVFGGAKPTHSYHISYPRRIAVIFEFNHFVICGMCSGPDNARLPHGKVIRVSFDKQTHQLTDSIQFCEIKGAKPSRVLCLRR